MQRNVHPANAFHPDSIRMKKIGNIGSPLAGGSPRHQQHLTERMSFQLRTAVVIGYKEFRHRYRVTSDYKIR